MITTLLQISGAVVIALGLIALAGGLGKLAGLTCRYKDKK